MTGIIEFIEARLAEDQAMIDRNSNCHGLADGFPDYRTYDDRDTEAADAYIEHFGPARQLAEGALWRSLSEDYRIVLANNAIEKANGADQVKIAGRGLVAKALLLLLRRRARAVDQGRVGEEDPWAHVCSLSLCLTAGARRRSGGDRGERGEA